MRLPELPAYVTTDEARKAGLSEGRLTALVASGRLRRVRRGLYAVVRPEALPPSARRADHLLLVSATLLGHESRVAASHLSAAAAWDLPLPLGGIDVVHALRVDGASRTRRTPGLLVHHADSGEVATQVLGELLVTGAARTVADCLVGFPPRVSVPIADCALHRTVTTPDEIWSELSMKCHWDGRVRWADLALPTIDGRRESWLESYAAVLFVEWGIDPPVPQLIVSDERGHFVARADAGWEGDATVIELDGKEKYSMGEDAPATAWDAEKDRFDAVGNLGVERVRFGLHQLLHEPALVKRRVAARRAAGSRERFTGSFTTLPPLTIPWF